MEVIVNFRQSSESKRVFPVQVSPAESSVGELKRLISSHTGTDTGKLCLTYCGRILNDEELVLTLGLCAGSVVHAIVLPQNEMSQPHVLTHDEQRELILNFRTAMTNPNFRQVLQKYSEPEKFAELVASTPGLDEDPVAKSFIRDWELLLHLADSKSLQKIVKNHPVLAEAGTRIAASLRELSPAYDLRTLRGSRTGRLARSLGADLDDDDEMVGGEPQQPFALQNASSTITPEQLAQALAFAQRSLRTPAGPSTSTASSRSQPSTSSASPSSALTQQMLSDALMQAIASAGSSRPQENTGSGLQEQFGRFLPQMRELGITDDTLSLRALQATNGDVQAAVNLIFAGLMDD